MYGLPQSGVLAHAKLKSVLAPHGYAPTKNTPDIWTHSTHPISFALVLDDLGVKYIGEHRRDLPVLHYHEIMVIYTYPFFVVITQLFC